MEPAKKLEKFAIRYYGPYSEEAFSYAYVEPLEFEFVAVGSGESKAVATDRAFAHLQGQDFSPILNEIQMHINLNMPRFPNAIEGDSECAVYCSIAVKAIR